MRLERLKVMNDGKNSRVDDERVTIVIILFLMCLLRPKSLYSNLYYEYDNMKKVKCDLCGHEWLPRVEKPVSCPRCKRMDYKKEDQK